ncbi:MAG TPA: hypothetical protein VE820_03650, partial [Sphingomicrobium sp.]|nr:hypothetical protein [Sphingomicrobium sp.]
MKFLSLPHLATRVFGTPLAIEPQKLEAIVQAIGPRLQGMPMMDREDMMDMPAAAPAPDGIAIIDISGTLVRKATGMQALSGLTSYA